MSARRLRDQSREGFGTLILRVLMVAHCRPFVHPTPPSLCQASPRSATTPDGVSTVVTRSSWGSAGTSASSSPSYSSATTAVPGRTRASARSYEPPPRPSLTPDAETATAGTSTRSARLTAIGPEPGSRRLAETSTRPDQRGRRGQRPGTRVRRPVKIPIRTQHGQQDGRDHLGERLEQLRTARLTRHRRVRGHDRQALRERHRARDQGRVRRGSLGHRHGSPRGEHRRAHPTLLRPDLGPIRCLIANHVPPMCARGCHSSPNPRGRSRCWSRQHG